MSLSYPLSLPSGVTPNSIQIRANSVVGVSASPFTFSQQVYAHAGEMWEADVEYPPLDRDDAHNLFAVLLGLNGQEGTLLMGDPANPAPRGTWASPLLSGAHAAGVKTLTVRNVDGLTWEAGDWLQFGSGSSTHLHKVVQAGSQAGSPSTGTVEIWPRTRAAYADGEAITLTATKGLWRLASNMRAMSVEVGQEYGIRLSLIEAISA